MAATFGAGSTEYDDPQFQEAATHFHMGQWDKAIRILAVSYTHLDVYKRQAEV